MSKKSVLYIGILIFSVLFLVIGNRITRIDFYSLTNMAARPFYVGVVTEILDRQEEVFLSETDGEVVNTTVIFNARITTAARHGEIKMGRQILSAFIPVNEREVSVGDRVLLAYHGGALYLNFTNYIRIHFIVIFGVIFSALVILCGRKNGINALIALGLTCIAIFFVFVPAIFAGFNIYISTFIICIYSIITTLLLVIGPNKKALSAIIGCVGGVFVAGLSVFIMNVVLGLTGIWDSDTLRIARLFNDNPIDMNALIFAGVILGALGAIMDVAMSIASSTWEVKQAKKGYWGQNIFMSGINIGKDLLSTSLSTLVLAYIGTSVSLIVLLMSQNPSITLFFNREMIIVEFLRALVGSFAMLLTIPLTAWVCDRLYYSPSDFDYDIEELEQAMETAEQNEVKTVNVKAWGFYFIVLILSVMFIFIGNNITSRNVVYSGFEQDIHYYPATITQIINRTETGSFVNTTFYARITRGQRRGEIITAEQRLTAFFAVNAREVTEGDRVLVLGNAYDVYAFSNFARMNDIVIFGAVFFVFVIVFCRKKGFDAIIALVLTCSAIFMVFVPAILSGRNIYVTTIVVCVFSIISTLLIVNGATKKALAAILGCLGGVLSSAVLMVIMDLTLRLTGAVDMETQELLFLPLENPINLRGIIFAGVILGAVGAIMDVAMSIASSLSEVKTVAGVSGFGSILKSGINIGRDLLGTMFSTLILAYIGSSLTMVLVIYLGTTSLMHIFSGEIIIVEFLRALVGGLGMLLTIPLTAVICGWLYQHQQN